MWKVPYIFKKDWREPSYYSALADPETLCLVKYKQKMKFAPTSYTDALQKMAEALPKMLKHKFLTTELC